MEAILFKNGIYVRVNPGIDRTLDAQKIRESEEYIIEGGTDKEHDALLYGNRVKIHALCCYYSNYDRDGVFNLYVDGIEIHFLENGNTGSIVSCLNQMEQFGVDTFLANYKQALEKTKEELTAMCDKMSSELSVQEDEEKSKLLNHLRNRIEDLISASLSNKKI